MLTPVEIGSYSFRTGIGYDKKEVEAFREVVQKDFEALYRTNIELKDKVTVLNDGIQHYKILEDSMQKALVLAQRTADEVIKNAHIKAENIREEARNQACEELLEGRHEQELLQTQIENLKQDYIRYKLEFKQLLRTQQELLDSLELTRQDKLTE